ncbi:hypothetical protein FG379_001356 [Cryptosporidium bovis]|uniref:uncharacterized protein n=1 Tax=Cryptosporidium bovis TaxID=310047 RepID=UPI00351A1D1B|nr:hypothetical protein FG379_001356 [Cryptosporidium bovis]
MESLREILIDRFIYSFPLIFQGHLEVNLYFSKLEIQTVVEIIEHKKEVCSRKHLGVLTLILVSFENEKFNRKKLFGLLGGIIMDNTLSNREAECFQLLCEIIELFLKFLIENCKNDINTQIYGRKLGFGYVESNIILRKYIFLIQHFLSSTFDTLFSNINIDLVDNDIFCSYCSNVINELDFFLKNLIIFITVCPVDFIDLKKICDNGLNLESSIQVHFDQNLLHMLVSSTIKIMNIMVKYCKTEKFVDFLGSYTLEKYKSSHEKLIGKIVYFLILELLSESNVLILNKELIISLGIYLSFFFIINSCSFSLFSNNSIYFDFKSINTKVEHFIINNKFSKVGFISFYRGIVISRPLFINPLGTTSVNVGSLDKHFFSYTFIYFKDVLDNYCSNEHCLLAIQSINAWVSILIKELNALNNKAVLLDSCFNIYITSIYNILFSFLNQNVNYYLKSIIQLLEEFVELILTLDCYLEGNDLFELNSNPLNWLIKSVLSNNWNNVKYKYFFLERILNRIVILYKNKSIDYLEFGKLSSLQNFRFCADDKNELEIINDTETNLLFCLLYSLSVQNISSSAYNLIVTWYKLYDLPFYYKNNVHVSKDRYGFLDFLLFSTVNIITNNFKFDDCNIITDEIKYTIFKKVLKIFKVSNRKYYKEKLIFIFHLINTRFCMHKISREHNSNLNPFLLVILPELKKNNVLFWQNCVDADCHTTNLNLVVLDIPCTKVLIKGSHLVENISSFNSEMISSILELASIKTSVNDNRINIENMNLINELELLFAIISNINTIGIQRGVFTKLMIIVEEKFVSSKKVLLRSKLLVEVKEKVCTLLRRIFNFVFTSLGLHISYDKTDFFLRILCQFIEVFYNEDMFTSLFEKLTNHNSKLDFSNTIVSRLQTLLFSTSVSTRDFIIEMILKNQRFKSMFCDFHFNQYNYEFEIQMDATMSVLKPLISGLKPREYKASSIILFTYLQKILCDDNEEKLSNLLMKVLNINNINKSIFTSKSNINLIHLFNSELFSRLNNSFAEKNCLIVLNGESGIEIPLHSIVNILGICYKLETEFPDSQNYTHDNSKDDINILFNSAFESIYLLIICLTVLLRVNNNLLRCTSMNAIKYENLEYQISQTIDEINRLFRTIVAFENILLISPKNLHINYIVCRELDDSIDKELFKFIESLNSAILSGNTVSFVNSTCTLIIQLILSSYHPGISNSLQELFSAFSSYISNLKSGISKFHSNNTHFKIDTVKLKIGISNELVSYLENKEFNHLKMQEGNSKCNSLIIGNTIACGKLIELPKIWILNLVHSIIPFESREISTRNQEVNPSVENSFLDAEKINNIFNIIIRKNDNNCLCDTSKYLIKYNLYDIIKIFKEEYFNEFKIPSPKRNSANLSNVFGTIISLLLENTETYFVKVLLKLCIVMSLSSYDSKENIYVLHLNDHSRNIKIGDHTIHFNNILALLINKSRIGNGSGSLLEFLDADILCGSLISAFISIKIYNLEMENNKRFMLCNSSLNLMSSLIKRFAFEPFGNEEYLNNFKNYNERLKFRRIKNNFDYNNRDVGINISEYYSMINLSRFPNKVVLQYYSSILIQNSFNSCYSLKSMMKNTDLFESCITEALLNSNHYQFQGMTLLFLSEISISWFDCSRDMAIAIIKTLYSPSYFIRSYSARLLTNIILRSLNSKNIMNSKAEIFEGKIDDKIFGILSERITHTHYRKHSLIRLLNDLIEYSLFCELPIKYNLLHGTLLLGINLMKRPNVKLFLSIMASESENVDLYIQKSLNLLLENSSKEIFKNYLVRVSMYEFLNLLLDLEFTDKVKFEFKFKFQLYENNDFRGTQISLYKMKPRNFFHEVFDKSVIEFINIIQVLSFRAIKGGRYCELFELNNILIQKKTKINNETSIYTHPKVLSEFYSVIWENLQFVPEVSIELFVNIIIELLNIHIRTLYDFFTYLNSHKIQVEQMNHFYVITLENIRTIVEFASLLARDQIISEIILSNRNLELNIDLHIKLIGKVISKDNYNSPISKKTNTTYKNLKHSTSLHKNSEFIHNLLIVYVRFYFPLSNRTDANDYKCTSEIFSDYIDGLFSEQSQFSYLNLTEFNKYDLCYLKEIIFFNIKNELELFGINFTNFDVDKIKENFKYKNSTISAYFLFNKNCWYNLMLSFILLSSSEIVEIRLKCQQIFCKYSNTIKLFSCIVSESPSITLDNDESRSIRCMINFVIKYNNDESCIFSLFMMDSLSRIILNPNGKEVSTQLFPREVENIHNEYIFTLQILYNNIMKYLTFIKGESVSSERLSKIEPYISMWENDISSQVNFFNQLEKSINCVPIELFTMDLFGNILKTEIDIYLFFILLMKWEIVIKFKTTVGRENKINHMLNNIKSHRCKLDCILSEVHKNST